MESVRMVMKVPSRSELRVVMEGTWKVEKGWKALSEVRRWSERDRINPDHSTVRSLSTRIGILPTAAIQVKSNQLLFTTTAKGSRPSRAKFNNGDCRSLLGFRVLRLKFFSSKLGFGAQSLVS